ncbi:MAG: hypothetical protein RI637_09580, partial [Acidimicrobiia bacterium]|nr:hypothetical protein [Acidimicrobiia bacterium]
MLHFKLRRLAVFVVALLLAGAVTPAGATFEVAAAAQLPPMPVEGLFTGAPPEVTAQTWILYDATYHQVLAEQDPDQPRP